MHLVCQLPVDLSMTGKYQPAERKFHFSQRMRALVQENETYIIDHENYFYSIIPLKDNRVVYTDAVEM
jgi:hypothetical protein